MRKYPILIIICCIIYTSLTGQVSTQTDSISKPILTKPDPASKLKGTVSGIITDDKNHQPIIGATILYDDNAGGTITDIDGKYVLHLPAGHHTIAVRFIGYDTTYQFVRVIENKEEVQNLTLKKTEQEVGLVTVTGSKYTKKFGEDVVSVEILRPEFIENSNSVNLNEALDKVPGVTMIGEQVNIRGGAGYSAGAASRVLALMDGLPLLTPDNATIEFSSLPLENVEQIEVIKGASSALYGSSALDGIINVITANPKTEPFTKLTVFYGLYENPFSGGDKKFYWYPKRPMFGGASFSHRKKYKNLDVVIGGAYYQDKSYLAHDESKRTRLNIKLRYHPEKVPGLTCGVNMNFSESDGGFFFVWGGWSKKNVDTSYYNNSTLVHTNLDSAAYTPNSPGTFRTVPINVDPYVTYFDKRGNMHSFKGRIYYVASQSQDSSNIKYGGERSNAGLYYGEYNFHRDLKMIGVNLVAGLVGTYSNIQSLTFMNRKERSGAVFVQLDKKFFNRLTISIGGRAEITQLDTLKTSAVPIVRSGINYQITESTFLRASFGQGYRYPSIAEKFVDTHRSGIHVIPNPALQPESGYGGELGVKQAFKVGKKWIAYLDLAGFVTQYKNLIEFDFSKDGSGAFQAQNITDARISGIDASALGDGKIFGYPLNFMVGYTYLIPLDLNAKPTAARPTTDLNYRSRHSAKADVETTIKHVIAGITATYVSFMNNIDPNINFVSNISDFRKYDKMGNFALDARIGYSLNEGTRVSFIAKNVLNAQYSLRPGYLEAPRNYTVQLSYQF